MQSIIFFFFLLIGNMIYIYFADTIWSNWRLASIWYCSNTRKLHHMYCLPLTCIFFLLLFYYSFMFATQNLLQTDWYFWLFLFFLYLDNFYNVLWFLYFTFAHWIMGYHKICIELLTKVLYLYIAIFLYPFFFRYTGFKTLIFKSRVYLLEFSILKMFK